MEKGKRTILIVFFALVCGLVAVVSVIMLGSKEASGGDGEKGTETEQNTESEQRTEMEEEVPSVNSQTLQHFLEIALEPVGSTMYVWGGGWNEEDTGAGIGATHIGLYPKWKEFADKQDENYNYKNHRYELENGLDCSGYVGWTLYNAFETENGKTGYVTKATKMAAFLTDKDWGTLIENPSQFKPGDIVSMKRHVWICLGACEDGSVLLVHSAPPGVSVCGTPSAAGKKESMAVELATEYMKENYPEWQEKYPKRVVSSSFVKDIHVFRWSNSVMADAEKMQTMSGEEILELLK